MYKKGIFTVCANEPVAKDVYRMRLCGDTQYITAPGQFVNIELEGFYLRRPISVCDWDEVGVTIIYKVVGQGTKAMASMGEGMELDLLTGLGNGYDAAKSGERPLLVGGGAGVPPLYALAKKLIAQGLRPAAVLGFNTLEDVFYEAEFRALGMDVVVCTADGSYGVRGFVTDGIKGLEGDYFYACGPEPMLRALYMCMDTDGQMSFEERMGCGFGACMGCSCETKYGAKRICVDGPVLEKGEIVW